MDLWTDPNMRSFMAVTAHWMEAFTHETPSGSYSSVRLRSELAAFIQVPLRHTGEHLFEAFHYVCERLHIQGVSTV